jgi:16S rRNA (guanine1207-N2)-methyltransferase
MNFTFAGEDYIFKTDPRLFSPNILDNGSKLLLESLIIKTSPRAIIDIGCGWGGMGIILAKIYPTAQVLLLDNDPVAFAITKENILLNKISNAKAFKGDIRRSIVNRTFDLAVTNPPWDKNNSVIPTLIKFAFYNLCLSGQFYMVINQTFKAEERITKYFQNCKVVASNPPYKILLATKNSSSWSAGAHELAEV